MNSPLIQTITLSSSANSQQVLYTLLNALTQSASMRKVACYLEIQADTNGAAQLWAVGNSNVKVATASSPGTGIGRQLVASGTYVLGPFTSNEIHLDQMYVSSNTASAILNVTVVTR